LPGNLAAHGFAGEWNRTATRTRIRPPVSRTTTRKEASRPVSRHLRGRAGVRRSRGRPLDSAVVFRGAVGCRLRRGTSSQTTSSSKLVAFESRFPAGSIGLRRRLAGALRCDFCAPCAHVVDAFLAGAAGRATFVVPESTKGRRMTVLKRITFCVGVFCFTASSAVVQGTELIPPLAAMRTDRPRVLLRPEAARGRRSRAPSDRRDDQDGPGRPGVLAGRPGHVPGK
jgi:hypothetical protein